MTKKDDLEKGEELLKKRDLAAKGLKVRSDGKPVDPLADIDSLDPDDKKISPEEVEEREGNLAARILPVAAALKRSG